jgi:hypothetical protein
MLLPATSLQLLLLLLLLLLVCRLRQLQASVELHLCGLLYRLLRQYNPCDMCPTTGTNPSNTRSSSSSSTSSSSSSSSSSDGSSVFISIRARAAQPLPHHSRHHLSPCDHRGLVGFSAVARGST